MPQGAGAPVVAGIFVGPTVYQPVRHSLEAQPLEFDAGGQPYSRRYGDRYASGDGAIGQARHVFLAGNGLPRAWAGRRHFVILETGFGLGNNFLATWQAWREDPQRPRRLHFVSVEQHPLRRQDLLALAAQPPAGMSAAGLSELRRRLADQWPLPLSGLHRLEFEDGGLVLTLALGDAATVVPRLALGADAFYLDGFAPDRNPAMWDAQLIQALSRLARPGATAATYTCARAVRDALAKHGFAVERRPGYGGKRQMLAAKYLPQWKMRRYEPPAAYQGPQRAIVIGAGLAGCCCAYALRRRGWQVTLLEQGTGTAAGASGLPAGLLHPLLSADDNLASRLSRAGFEYGLKLLQQLEPLEAAARAPRSALWAACGVFQQARDDVQAAELRAAMDADPWPEAFAAYRTAGQVQAQLGLAPRHGGVWFARAAVVSAARWCDALVAAACAGGCGGDVTTAPDGAAPAFELKTNVRVVELRRLEGEWRVRDAQGRPYQAPIVVLANAGGSARLLAHSSVALQQIDGRISLLQAPELSALRAGISGEGYLIPPLLGPAAVGATYELRPARGHCDDPCPDAAAPVDGDDAAHAQNLRRLERLLADAPAVRVERIFAGQRCVSADRLPLAGPIVDEALAQAPTEARLRGAHLRELPRQQGLYCLAALGSRGLSLAALLGEHVAALISGEPSPIEADLAAAVDPGRFLLRQIRSGRT